MDDCYISPNDPNNRDIPEGESELPFDIGDLPPEIRMKIDEIVRNNEDFEAQIDAIDALLFGHRQQIDADNESGIDLESTSSGSNAASIASSSEYFVGNSNSNGNGNGNSNGVLVSHRQSSPTSTTMIASPLDDADDYVTQFMVPPPPEFFNDSEVGDDVIATTPVFRFELPPPIDEESSFQLPPIVELSDDDHREIRTPVPDYDVDGDCFGIPPPSEFDFSFPVVTPTVPEVDEPIAVTSSSSSASRNAPPVASKPLLKKATTTVDLSSSNVEISQDIRSVIVIAPQVDKDKNRLTSSLSVPFLSDYKKNIETNVRTDEKPSNNGFVVMRERKETPEVAAAVNRLEPRTNAPTITGSSLAVSSSGDLHAGNSPTPERRRFIGTTETQARETADGKKKKKSILQKFLKRGSLKSVPAADKEKAASASGSGNFGTLPSRSKPQSPTSASSISPLTSKTAEGISDSLTQNATNSRSTSATNHSRKPPASSLRISKHFFKKNGSGDNGDGDKRLSAEVTSSSNMSERQTVSSAMLPRQSSHDPSLAPPVNQRVIVDQLSKSARFERGLTELDEAAAAGLHKTHWSAGEEDDDENSSTVSSTTSGDNDDDEDEYDEIMRRMEMRSRLRDETGRLTIVPSIDQTLAKATSMMALNQVGLGSTSGKSKSSLTTDDIGFNSIRLKQQKRNNDVTGGLVQTQFSAPGGSSPRSIGRSPRSARSNVVSTSSTYFQTVQEDDEVFGLRRSDYLRSTSSFGTVLSAPTKSQTPSAITDRLLRRSMIAEPGDPSSLLEADTMTWLGVRATMPTTSFSASADGEIKVLTSTERPVNHVRFEPNKFNTFRGGMNPPRWSEDGDDRVVKYPSTFGQTRGRDAINGGGGGAGGCLPVAKGKSRMSVPPDWIFIKSPTTELPDSSKTDSSVPQTTKAGSANESGAEVVQPKMPPMKPTLMARPMSLTADRRRNVTEVPVPRVEAAISSAPRGELKPNDKVLQQQQQQPKQLRRQREVTESQFSPVPNDVMCDIPPPPDYLFDGNASTSTDAVADLEVLPAPPDEYSEQCAEVAPPDVHEFNSATECYSLATKSYGSHPIHEAISDQRIIVADLGVTKSMLLGNANHPDSASTSGDRKNAVDELPTIVRSFVGDSKNFVAAACACARTSGGDGSRTNAELRPVTERAMRKLGSLSVACRRLTVDSLNCRSVDAPVPLSIVVQVVDYAVDVTSVFGEMLDASRLIVESRSEAGRKFAVDSLNGHAVGLARVLVGFVQRVRTMR